MERAEGEHFEPKPIADETGYSEQKADLAREGGVGEGNQQKVQALFDPQNLKQQKKKQIVTVFTVHEEER